MIQKINKDIQDLNSDLEQVNSVNIYKILHPGSTEHTFFSVSHYTYLETDHIIGSKSLFSIAHFTDLNEILVGCSL